MSFKGVIFDLDGTLVDSMEDIAASMNAVLQENKFPTHGLQTYYQLVGSGLMDLVTRATPEAQKDKADLSRYYNRMIELYGQNCVNHTKPYTGIVELLQALKTCHLKLNVLSNKADDFTKKVVETLMPGYFDIVMGLMKEEHKKPNPVNAIRISAELEIKPEELIYVGDSGIDMETAKNAGMYAVGVLWGYRDEKELWSRGADLVVKEPSELLKIIR